jgi:hypothetical protein
MLNLDLLEFPPAFLRLTFGASSLSSSEELYFFRFRYFEFEELPFPFEDLDCFSSG